MLWLLAGLALLCCLPFLIAEIPEMVDAPNHVARIHILAAGNENPARYFTIHWRWMGNLGLDLPALMIARLLGVEAAVTCVIATIVPLTILGLYRLSHAAYGRFTGMAGLALPLALSQIFLWGFISYNLSIALALIVAASWLREPPVEWKRASLFAIGGVIVWTAHAMGWGVLLLLIAGFELGRYGADWRQIPVRLPFGLPLLLPLLPMAFWRSPGAAPLAHYDHGLLAEKAMNFVTILRGTSKPVDLAMTAALALIALAALERTRRIDPRLGAAGAIMLLATLVLPTSMMDSWAADMRIVPVATIVAFIAVPVAAASRLDRILLIAGVAMLLLRLTMICLSWHAADVVHRPQLALLDKVPRGSRIAFAAVRSKCGTPWPLRSDHHIGSYAITRRDGFTNTMFVVRGADLVTVRDPADATIWIDGSQDVATTQCPAGKAAPARFNGAIAAMAARFDMIWLVSADGTPLESMPPVDGLRIVGRAPGSLLLGR